MQLKLISEGLQPINIGVDKDSAFLNAIKDVFFILIFYIYIYIFLHITY